MKKIKVFLGGYINYTNAQNINCRALAEHLDNDVFEVFALKIYFGKKEDVYINTFYCFKPFKITKHLGFLWGVLKCDIAYLPKHVDTPIWVLKLAKILQKPIFTTIEGNVINKSLPNLIDLFGSESTIKKYFALMNKIFGITNFIKNNTAGMLQMEDSILQLGVDRDKFSFSIKSKLNSIVFLGSLVKRKQIEELIYLARNYPQICFNLIGDGNYRDSLQKNASKNIIFHGILSHNSINEIFKVSELMFLPSKSEGFPKVILEAASAGIPSVVYNTYGASEWIENYKNGFIVNDIEEVKKVINILIDKPEILKENSKNVIKLAEKFDWKIVIKSWEKQIEDLYYGK